MYQTVAFREDGNGREIFSIDNARQVRVEGLNQRTSKRTILVCSLILISLTGLLTTWVFVAKPTFYPKVFSRSSQKTYQGQHFLVQSRQRRDIYDVVRRPLVVEELTNPKQFPLKSGRLPYNIVPEDYFIDLTIDLQANHFNGSCTILVTCEQKTNLVFFHGRRLHLESVSVYSDRSEIQYRRVMYLKKYELYAVELDGDLEEGRLFEIDINYNVAFGKNLAGLYKSNYISKEGIQRTIVSTHFEPTDARSAFPCLDEPFFKAQFHVSITHDKAFTALSNMPVKQQFKVDNVTVKDEFEGSVKMSTYLVAFTVNDFKWKENTTKSGKQVRVYAREDDYNRIDYALLAATAIIDFYEQFFQAKYPLPKLDLLAVPDFMAGAMEDWGLVSFRSAYLVFDEEIMTVESMRQVTLVIAHELAHQWFGNLVTMKWWNDIWLNEGFANYVEMIGADVVNKQFHAIDMQVPTGWQAAINMDSLKNSHPVSQDVKRNSEIDEMFDAISYNKGASLLRMVEGFMGEEMIHGVNTYISNYQFSNAETDDLWKHLTNASGTLNIKEIMDTWTRQRSFPVVTLTRGAGSNFLVQQESFLEIKERLENNTSTTPNASLWKIPFTYVTDQTFNLQTVWLNEREKSLNIEAPMWIKANIDSRGFYVVNYDEKTWHGLHRQLIDNHKVFSDVNRASIIHDAFKLACEEMLDPIVALNITRYMSKERDFIPWAMTRSKAECFSMMLQDHALKRKFKKYIWSLMSHLVRPCMLDYGEEKRAREKLSVYERLQRLETFSFVLKHKFNTEIHEKVNQIFEELSRGKRLVGLSPENRAIALMYGYNMTSVSHWRFLWKLYEVSEVDTDRKIVMKAFAQFKDKGKINEVLEKSLNKSIMRVQDTIPLLANIVKLGSRKQVWDFVCKNYDSFKDRYGGGYQLGQLLNEVAGGFNTWSQYKEVRTFFKKHPIGARNSRTEKQILEKIKNNIRRHEPEVAHKHSKRIASWLDEELNKRDKIHKNNQDNI